MRLGILGPALGNLPALARAAQRLLDEAQAERVIYLAEDGALDRVVERWARGLVGGDPREQALFSRTLRCATATAEEIDVIVAAERARRRLEVFVSLPPGQRTIELLDNRVALFVFDKATLDEEDIAAASVLVFGKSEVPMIRRVGARTFVAPGPIGVDGGAALLDDRGGGLCVELRDASGAVTARDLVGVAQAGAKMRVQGGSQG